MIIDIHGHACGPYLTIKSMTKVINDFNVRYLVLLPGEKNSKKEYSFKIKKHGEPLIFFNILIGIVTKLSFATKNIDYGNNYVYSLSRENPDRILQFYWITKSNIEKFKRDYDTMLYKGIKLHQCWDYIDVKSKNFKLITDFASDKKIPVMIHPVNKKQIVKLKEVIKNGNKCRFIIAHLFGFELFENDWEEYRAQIFFDVSNAFWITEERFKSAVRIIGDDNLLFGSDTPYGENVIQCTINLVNGVISDNNSRNKIFCENALHLLGLDILR